MSTFVSQVDFNTYLSINLSNLTLKNYFTKYIEQFNNGANKVDISFMDYFLYLCNHKNEFVVEHEKLKEYGVLTDITTSAKVKRSLDQFDLEEEIDYQVSNVGQQSDSSRGVKYCKQYTLTPRAFKLCLIRSKNSRKYANYYLLLEEVINSYNEYEKMCKDNMLAKKDTKIDELTQKVDNQSKQMENQSKQIAELLQYARDTKETLEETNEKLEETNDKLDNAVDKLEDVKEAFEETANRSVPSPKNEKDSHEFILLQSKNSVSELRFIRGMFERNERMINNKYKDYNIIKRDYNANPIQLFKMFKEVMKEKYNIQKKAISANKSLKNKVELKRKVEKIKFVGCRMTLFENYSVDDLLNELQTVCDEKFSPVKDMFYEEIP